MDPLTKEDGIINGIGRVMADWQQSAYPKMGH